MKQATHLKREDFGKNVNAEGYQITYKGKNIGGAGILGKFKGRGRSQQIKDYSDRATREINSLIDGNGMPHYYKAVDEINATNPVKETEPDPTSKEGLEDGGFTKGDWKIVPISDCCLTVQVDGFREDKKGGYIAEIKWERAAGGIGKEDEANARLIAAAPAMYEALKGAKKLLLQMGVYVRQLDNNDELSEYWNQDGDYIAQTEFKEIEAILTRINKD